jgi:hypothetical protein
MARVTATLEATPHSALLPQAVRFPTPWPATFPFAAQRAPDTSSFASTAPPETARYSACEPWTRPSD